MVWCAMGDRSHGSRHHQRTDAILPSGDLLEPRSSPTPILPHFHILHSPSARSPRSVSAPVAPRRVTEPAFCAMEISARIKRICSGARVWYDVMLGL
jgi:hypothetical protein